MSSVKTNDYNENFTWATFLDLAFECLYLPNPPVSGK